ncbi:MAG: tRNA1(Val) (adenine(37)-N6)-methyltransferase [bacterium]
MFNFSLDTVLLANFCSLLKDNPLIIDLGTNNAAIPLLLSKKTDVPIIGVEIQEEAVDLARRNVALNHLEHQIEIVHDDIRHYATLGKHARLVLCNPPFFKVGERSNLNESRYLQIARHEIMIDLEGIIQSAAALLDHKGRFALVHRPERMVEIIELMKKYQIEPKRMRFVYPKMHKDANVFLIEGLYKGNPGLIIEPPLYAHNDDGSYSDEVMKMFGGE